MSQRLEQLKEAQRKARLEAKIKKFTSHADELEAADPVANKAKIDNIRLAVEFDRTLIDDPDATFPRIDSENPVKRSLMDRLFGPLS
ncbi:hypothetical protein [Sinimarinibacterium flocculans]|uniref:hypothetical protein n=1 Tax=Sinimarinibacterium flocculans TaxID=985250 RepID=UPI0024918F8D|nr:hypothetical protein [Sinimarinibacterium flocculans]